MSGYLFWRMVVPLQVVWLGPELARRFLATPLLESLLFGFLLVASALLWHHHFPPHQQQQRVKLPLPPQRGNSKFILATIASKLPPVDRQLVSTPIISTNKVDVSTPDKVEVSTPDKVEVSTPDKVEVSTPNKVEVSTTVRVFKRSSSRPQSTTVPTEESLSSFINRKTGEFEHSFASPDTPPTSVVDNTIVNRKTGEFEFSKPVDLLPPSISRSASSDRTISSSSIVNRKTGEFEHSFDQVQNEASIRPQSRAEAISRDSSSIVNRKTGEFEHSFEPVPTTRPRLLSIESIVKRRFSLSRSDPISHLDNKPSLFLSSINKLRRIPSSNSLFKPKREAC